VSILGCLSFAYEKELFDRTAASLLLINSSGIPPLQMSLGKAWQKHVDVSMLKGLREVTNKTGFHLSDTPLKLSGVCKKCI
tara:strand:- start:2975 stop:3217 length:243 start_codon:yes stop_codon:yes gene_type:complete